MTRPARHPLITGTVITALGTLACRVLGMLRDMATAALLGLAGGGIMDAFVIAFRIPNLFRRLFGEGALTASYLPVLTSHLENDRQAAGQLASVVVTLLALLLAGLVAAGELLVGLIWLIWGDVEGVGLLMGLSAVMLPYLLLICIAAQLTTMLYAAQHFTVPALDARRVEYRLAHRGVGRGAVVCPESSGPGLRAGRGRGGGRGGCK